jgi:hypothetical protein
MNADLVAVVCGCRCGLDLGCGKSSHIPKHVETLNLSKVIVKVKCVSSWLCLLCNYITMMYSQQNIKLNIRISFRD